MTQQKNTATLADPASSREGDTVGLTLKEAAAHSGVSLSTINRYIADGKLPAYKMRGKNYVTPGDLEAAFGPVPVIPTSSGVTDEGLRAWAERVAATAPPLRAEQRDIIISAFSTALADD
jgi:excisionase family DNA binding protein